MSDGNCSFCGKRHDEVFRIVAGASCAICSECIGKTADMMADEFRHVVRDLTFSPHDNGGNDAA